MPTQDVQLPFCVQAMQLVMTEQREQPENELTKEMGAVQLVQRVALVQSMQFGIVIEQGKQAILELI